MKTRRFLFAASIMLAMVFTFSCSGGGGDDDSGGGGGGGGGSGGGRLTVTGLPSGQWTANVYAAGTDISNADAYMNAGLSKVEAAGSITNSNVFNLFNKTSLQFWTVSGSRYVALVGSEAADPVNPVYYRYATVDFSNGSATVSFSSFTPVTDLSGGNPGGGGGANSALNGTWVSASRERTLNNGNFEISSANGSPQFKGTYTISGNNCTFTATHIHGGMFISLESRWYTKDQFKEAIGSLVPTATIDAMYAPDTGTYSLSGNTLTMTGTETGTTTTYTKKS
ncbi:MAG: hypothetical protein LBQ87_05110 [Candidatus Fibromonas sp.]|jgi:hypothetical protein|nr:hypothetical protein [Candidatus Fibromonas sp.]